MEYLAEEDNEINISYETLFDILRREKDKNELQKLPASFFRDVSDYIRAKQSLLKKNMSGADEIPISEKQRVVMHLQNVRKILLELYNRRESKVIMLAQNKCKTNSSLIDTSTFLKAEEEMFEDLTAILTKKRKSTMNTFFKSDKPIINLELFMDDFPEEEQSTEIKSTPKETKKQDEAPAKEKKEEADPAMLIRIIEPVPKFVGRDLQTYGPFKPEDMTNLPIDLGEILVKKGKAEKM